MIYHKVFKMKFKQPFNILLIEVSLV